MCIVIFCTDEVSDITVIAHLKIFFKVSPILVINITSEAFEFRN